MNISRLINTAFLSFIAMLMCSTAPVYANSNFTITTVVLSGDPAPGAIEGSTFRAFDDVAVNKVGQVFFRGFLQTIGIEDCQDGLWLGVPDGLLLVACDGYAAPDTEEGVTFLGPGGGFPGSGIPDDLGQVGFNSRLSDSDILFDGGIWLGSPDNVRLLVREGDHAPGTPAGVIFSGISSDVIVLSNTGHIAFQSVLTGSDVNASNNNGVWVGSLPSNLSLVVRNGDPAPDTNDGVVFTDIDFRTRSAINDNGEVIFPADITGPGVTFENDKGIWIGGPHNLRLAIRKGNPIPGLPIGSNYERLFRPTLNNSGEIAFTSWVTGIPNTWWLWAGAPNMPNFVARAGDRAPGTETGIVFGNISYPILLNGAGEVAFKAFLEGPGLSSENNIGIWAGPPGELKLIARNDDQAPGALPGQKFSNLIFANISFNDSGSMAIASELTGFIPQNGVWLYTKSNGLKSVALPGQMLEVRPGDVRTILAADTSVKETGNQDGRRSSLSDTERVVFRASFDDDSNGVFLASPPPSVEEIIIDIKPKSVPNHINLDSNGVLAVAIITTDNFDALNVDPDTVLFGPTNAAKAHYRAHMKDVDKDGDTDMLLHFPIQESGILCDDTEATLTGQTRDGTPISGTDSVNTIKCL